MIRTAQWIEPGGCQCGFPEKKENQYAAGYSYREENQRTRVFYPTGPVWLKQVRIAAKALFELEGQFSSMELGNVRWQYTRASQ